jgi:hypothetical protein
MPIPNIKSIGIRGVIQDCLSSKNKQFYFKKSSLHQSLSFRAPPGKAVVFSSGKSKSTSAGFFIDFQLGASAVLVLAHKTIDS